MQIHPPQNSVQKPVTGTSAQPLRSRKNILNAVVRFFSKNLPEITVRNSCGTRDLLELLAKVR